MKGIVEYRIVMVGKVLFFTVYTSKGVITFTSCLSFLQIAFSASSIDKLFHVLHRVIVIVVVSPLN